jgi:hypothetical protein
VAVAHDARLSTQAVPVGASQTAGEPVLLINPRSFRASRGGLAERAAQLARAAGIEVVTATDPAHFRAAFDRLHQQHQAAVWLLSGDGTVQWIAEYLAQARGSWSPLLLLLGGGRDNIVPRECGGYPPMRALRAAAAAHRAGRPMARETLTTLRVSQPGGPVRHGFLFAGGLAHEGVCVCREHRASGTGWLHRGPAADPYALLKLLVRVWIGRGPPYTRMSVHLSDGSMLPVAPMRLLLASTLGMRDAPYNPFAETGKGSVRVTAIATTAPHFWRRLPGIMRGRFHASLTPTNGALSGRCAAAEVRGINAYSLDGESFTADPHLPLTIATGIELSVLRP